MGRSRQVYENRVKYLTFTLDCEPMGDYRKALLEARLVEAEAWLKAHPVCQRCHKPLKDPVSVAAGLGPDCRAQIAAEWDAFCSIEVES